MRHEVFVESVLVERLLML